MSGEHRATPEQWKAHPLQWKGLEKIAYGFSSDDLGSPEMLLLQMRCRIEALESGRADHPEPIMLTDDERETALTKMAEKPGGNIAASCVREMLCRIKALEANHFTAAELRARIEALEAAWLEQAEVRALSWAIVRRVEALEARRPTVQELCARVEALETATTCPHIVSSDEGTSYCRLAEQGAVPATTEARPGGLVERLGAVIEWGIDANQDPEGIARAASREVANWLRQNDAKCQMGGDAAATADLLEQEADRG